MPTSESVPVAEVSSNGTSTQREGEGASDGERKENAPVPEVSAPSSATDAQTSSDSGASSTEPMRTDSADADGASRSTLAPGNNDEASSENERA